MIDRSTVTRAVRAVLLLALLAFVAAFVVQAVPALVGAEQSYVVLTASMAPAISPGDAVIVDEVDPAGVEAGDVITYRTDADEKPVTHRVVEVVEGEGDRRFRTKGDNNEDPDPRLVHQDQLVGKVWFTLPYVGYVTQFANTTTGAAALIGVPLVLLVLSELWRRSGEATVTAAGAPSDGTDPAGDADGSGAVAEPGDDAVRLGPRDLRLGSLGFGSFTVYATYVALQDPTGLAVGVAVGAGITTAFHLAALVILRRAGSADTGAPADPDPDPAAVDARGGGDDD